MHKRKMQKQNFRFHMAKVSSIFCLQSIKKHKKDYYVTSVWAGKILFDQMTYTIDTKTNFDLQPLLFNTERKINPQKRKK